VGTVSSFGQQARIVCIAHGHSLDAPLLHIQILRFGSRVSFAQSHAVGNRSFKTRLDQSIFARGIDLLGRTKVFEKARYGDSAQTRVKG
jgi:hypothetical protein